MFLEKQIIMDNLPENIKGEFDYYQDEYQKLIQIPNSGKKPMQDYEDENSPLIKKPEYMEDLSHFINFTNSDIMGATSIPLYEKPKKHKKQEETIFEILSKNDIKFESQKELDEVLMGIRQTYQWEPGFNLQLGSKGRKIMLQLLRKAYKKTKKNKSIFMDKNPPTTISNLPFFKLAMLWELSYDLGVFEYAVVIHQVFGTQRKKNYNRSGPRAKPGPRSQKERGRGRRGRKHGYKRNKKEEEEEKENTQNIYTQNVKLNNQELKNKDQSIVPDLINEEDFFSSMNQNYNSVRFRYSTIDQFYQNALVENYSESQSSYMTTDGSEITHISDERDNMFVGTIGSLTIS